MTMKLYHLDWERAKDVLGDRFMSLILPGRDGDAQRALASEAYSMGLYDHVADVPDGDMAAAFHLTQNGDAEDSWSVRPPGGVRPAGPAGGEGRPRRSTSVGDVVMKDGLLHVLSTPGSEKGFPPPEAAAAMRP